MEKNVLANLEPKNVLRFFEELCDLPHGLEDEPASDWVERFAQERGLRCRRDEAGRVIIWKDASPGYEDHPAVMLRCCLEVTCSSSTEKADFDTLAKDGPRLTVDGDWIKPCRYGTSLPAGEGVGMDAAMTVMACENGIGVAMAMAVLDDGALPHPPLEAVFTARSGMWTSLEGTAVDLDCSDLKSRYLISIDSQEEGVLTGGCAGGTLCDITYEIPKDLDKALSGESAHWTCIDDHYYYPITLERIGPSSGKMHKGYANPIRLLAECCLELDYPHMMWDVEWEEQCDTVPQRVSASLWAQDKGELENLRAKVEAWAEKKKAGCPMAEDFILRWGEMEEDRKAGSGRSIIPSRAEDHRLVSMILEAPSGVIAMNPDLPDQAQSSVNMWITKRPARNTTGFDLSFCVYSSVPEEKERLVQRLREVAEAHGAAFSRYGWEYRQDSPLWKTAAAVFREQYGKEPKVKTIHTSQEEPIRECGVLTAKVPGLDAVSFGPDLMHAGFFEYWASLSSIRRTWGYLAALLARL